MSRFAEARILVVDDEPDVLEAYRHVLRDIVDPSADELAMLANTLFEQASPTLPARTTVAGVDLYRQGEEAEHLSSDGAAALRNRVIGFVFQSFHLLPRYTALENRWQQRSPAS